MNMDELFDMIHEFAIRGGEIPTAELTTDVDELCARIRGIDPGSAPAHAVFAPGERMIMLSLVRKEFKRTVKDLRRTEERPEEEVVYLVKYMQIRLSRLTRMYVKLGGNPDRMTEPIDRLKED